MRALRLAPALALLLVPAAGCMGGEEVTLDGGPPGPPCFARMSWTQADLFAAVRERGELEEPRPGLTLDPAAGELPNGTELHHVQWHPEHEDVDPARFSLSSPRWSEEAETVMLEARLLSDHEDQARGLAEAFLANVTDAPAEEVQRRAEAWLDRDVASFASVDPEGNETPITLYRIDAELSLALEPLVEEPDVRQQPATRADLDDLQLQADAWRLGGEVPTARATAPLADPSVQLTANPLDEVAVEVPVGDPHELPSPDLVNETFAHLDLPDPEPETWGYEDTCGVDVVRPSGVNASSR